MKTWLVHDLVGAPGVTGVVDDVSNADALREACAALVRAGAVRVVGPMEGSTWGRYRLALPPEPGDADVPAPAFPGEPSNEPSALEPWIDAGFLPVARYASTIVETSEVQPRPVSGDVVVRTFRPDRFEDELRILFELSLACFADNPWYAPIGFDAFRAMYDPWRGRIDPSFVWFAERKGGTPLGFQFSYPDPGGPGRAPGERVVAKTIGVVPAARGTGLGGHLLDRVQARAHETGARHVVHALMHEDNVSRTMSARRAARVFRRYALFQWMP